MQGKVFYMEVNAINSFAGGNNLQKTTEVKKQNFYSNLIKFEGTDTIELDKKVETTKNSNTGKKWGVGIASLIVPGLGQAANGQWGKAAGFFLGSCVALPILTGLSAFTFGPAAIVAASVLAQAGIRVWSITDAVKSVE